ncbi:hypothetical protein Enr13x_28100 [Stieleria neptunia]|uniref:Uncharacterized protein n=1 Tax=Stieleria neptunia TaxID=2527979 RepID=A0A518HQ38_9BACT|nr:hypothetical protein [Stieleria neptunia]QDV42958.1 hypothetical protein Enr13x_28100 [Stieleria neptunia]
MNVREFVKETIVEVMGGMNDANDELVKTRRDGRAIGSYGKDSKIKFDVAVTVASEKQGEGKTNLSVLGIGASGKLEAAISEACVSRIEFEIPVRFPDPSDHNPGPAFIAPADDDCSERV